MFAKKKIAITILASLSGVAIAEDNVTKLVPIQVVGKQDSYFEDINTTALKGQAADNETPFLVTSVNQTLIEDLRAERLEDVLAYSTGVTRSGNSADGFVIRGFDIDLNNLKVNGMSGITTRFGSPTTANIESIEILKGPASVLYGNMETGGVVNMITKKPQNETSGSIQVSAQTFGTGVSGVGDDNGLTTTIDLTGSVGQRDDLSYRFIVTGENINSFRENVNFENYHLAPSLLWEPDANNSLLLSLEVGKENGSADHGLFAAQQDINTVASIDTVYQEEDDFDNDEGLSLSADYTRILSDESKFNFKWRSVWHTDERRLFESNSVNNVDLDAGEDISDTTLRRRLRHQLNDRDWHAFDTYLTKALNEKHNITVGLMSEYRLTDFERIAFGSAGNVTPNVSIYDPVLGGTAESVAGTHRKTEYFSTGIYAQDKFNVTDKLTIVGSARLNSTQIDYFCVSGDCTDDNSTSTTDFVGSLGAVYKLTDSWSLYANSAQSFDPYTAERVDASGDALDAEQSQQFEVGVKYGISDRTNLTVSTYKINKENISETDNNGDFVTIGEVESTGLEVDLQWLPNDNWQIKAGYAYNDSEVIEGENTGLTPSHAPQNTAFLFTRYNLPEKVLGGEVGFSMGINYRDEVKTDISPANSVTLPSYATLDVGAYYKTKNWDWALNVENVTDKEYFYAGSDDERIYVGDPLKASLTATFNF